MVVRWSATRSSACRPSRSLSASRAEVALSSSSTGAFSIAESIRFVRPEASLDAQAATGEDNQILRHGGRTADGSSVAWAVAAKQVQVALKFVSSESRPRFVACMVRTAPRCKRHRGREIVLDAEQASVWRNRRAGRISEVDDGLLRTALYDAVHIILTTQGLFTTEELGDADRQARRHEQGQGGFACRLAVIMHRMLAERAPSTLQQSDRRRATVRARHHAFSKRSAFAGTMDHVRQNYKN